MQPKEVEIIEENISKKLCKKCEKELNIEDSIFNGYCEKCYNKWLNTKNKNYKQSPEHNNFSFFSKPDNYHNIQD